VIFPSAPLQHLDVQQHNGQVLPAGGAHII